MQAPPLAPQNCSLVPALHVLVAVSQHPVGQLVDVHVHTPLWHSSPEPQLVPLDFGAVPQVPFVHVACWQGFVGVGQSLALWHPPHPGTDAPPWQVPFRHVSPLVQGSPSSHDVPFLLWSATQLPVAGSHV